MPILQRRKVTCPESTAWKLQSNILVFSFVFKRHKRLNSPGLKVNSLGLTENFYLEAINKENVYT